MSSIEEKNNIIDGRKFSKEYTDNVLRPRCEIFKEKYGSIPKLSTIIVGNDPASESYRRIREKFFASLCVDYDVSSLPEETTQEELLELIAKQNNDDSIDGIMVQLPLPDHMDEDLVIESISPNKDIEGLSPGNVHAWTKSAPNLVPATALGVLALLKHYQVPLQGKHVVVVGRSMIVGKPVAHLLLKEHATVTVCHSRSRPLERYTLDADILIAAVGRAHLIRKGMVKKGVIIVDVGVNFEDGKLMGDTDFDDLKEDASLISPVPGGSGPATVCMLASNLFLAFELKQVKMNEEHQRCLRKYYANYEAIENKDSCL
ncbi:MAG: bifunctional methylenetetrahydrofolate dehydrogenase/methenyltetrahydrofolate cyclohydrolase [Candidatus Heimdallarchaeota archaeon]|nr:bifunctional methylenetetrahydrofolate dehydrogenase/methenyltetrahydrofolate cyclohydrolase [Candidatus Heimdallarchaeota archaeon]